MGCHKVFTNRRIFTFNNTLMKASSCIADIICITQITCKRINKTLLIHGWRLDFSYPEKYMLPIKEQKRPDTCLLEGHKQNHKSANQVMCHKPRTTEQPTKGVPQADWISSWYTVENDFFQRAGSDYFLIITELSNFVQRILKGQSNSRLMKQIFSEHVIPKVARSDSGPQYDRQALRYFAKENDLEHITSYPHFLRSNRFIESHVMAIKTSLRLTDSKLSTHQLNSYLDDPYKPFFQKDPRRQKKWRDHRKTRRKQQQKHYFHRGTKPTPAATYQHSRTTNPHMETSLYKGEYSKSSSILHHDNAWRKNTETESPTDKGCSSTHEAWQILTLTRPTSSHKQFKSTIQSLYDKELASCATAS